MKILRTNTFIRAAKKLRRNQVPSLKDAIEAIKQNPLTGELKKGDLAGIRVYKFRVLHQLILLAYLFDEKADEVTLLSFAPHENFYDALKKQIKD
jgi:mRNA-degrading endonuclease RelE of RelBE toxin-antitoxin system